MVVQTHPSLIKKNDHVILKYIQNFTIDHYDLVKAVDICLVVDVDVVIPKKFKVLGFIKYIGR
jgi:hypothetical protein